MIAKQKDPCYNGLVPRFAVRKGENPMLLTSNFILFHDELGVEKTIDVFAEAGFEGIEFNADLAEYCDATHDEAFYKNLGKYAKEKGVPITQAHAPFPSSYPDDETRTEQRFQEIVTSMRHAAWLGADMIVVHPCTHIDCTKDPTQFETMMAYNLDFYKRLAPYAEEFGIQIAIENIPRAVTVTPEGLLQLLYTLDNKVFTVCYDVGHANYLGQGSAEMILALGKVIGCTHIHDNDGAHDSHTLPYYGTIDWESVMKAFAEVGYEGNINYEAGYFVRRAPVALRQESAAYMVAVGKHLIERCRYYKAHR